MNDKWLPSPRELIRQERRKKIAQRKYLIAGFSTVVVLAGLITLVITSPGWAIVKKTFFDIDYGREVFPTVIKGILLNIKLTIIGSLCIGAIALLLAILRTTRSAALTPFRLLATAYVDVFRGIPLLLVIFLIGFGVPALGLK